MIKEGGIIVKDVHDIKPSMKIEAGWVIYCSILEAEDADPIPENIPLDILYEDDDVIVINKAAGMVVHPAAGNWSGTLVNALLYHCGDTLSGIGGVKRPGIVHRLDKDTSGVMLVAKNDHAHAHLSEQLADRTLSRIYHALVWDIPIPVIGTIDIPMGRDHNNRLKQAVKRGDANASRHAITHYKVLKTYCDAMALVECRLETGRTHQIRVHMQAKGHPLIGDPLYGAQKTLQISRSMRFDETIDKDAVLNFPRQALHAHEITFIHPTTDEEMHFTAPMPDDMCKIID
jgi:23S rRNA pseudouridine1911/1915/1917 synthase